MPFKFLDKVSIADTAFEATGKSLEEFFAACAQATTRTMVNPKTLAGKIKKEFVLDGEEIDTLLYDFLSEIIFLKDARSMIFKKVEVEIKEMKTQDSPNFRLKAKLWGEEINHEKHELKNDIKAITKHMFEIKKTEKGWKATVIVDI